MHYFRACILDKVGLGIYKMPTMQFPPHILGGHTCPTTLPTLITQRPHMHLNSLEQHVEGSVWCV